MDLKNRMSNKGLFVVLISVLFLVSIGSANVVTINPGTTSNHPGINMLINYTQQIQTDYLTIYDSAADMGGSNFSVEDITGQNQVTVSLKSYNSSKGIGYSISKFDVEATTGNTINVTATNLPSTGRYELIRSGSSVVKKEISGTFTATFTQSTSSHNIVLNHIPAEGENIDNIDVVSKNKTSDTITGFGTVSGTVVMDDNIDVNSTYELTNNGDTDLEGVIADFSDVSFGSGFVNITTKTFTIDIPANGSTTVSFVERGNLVKRSGVRGSCPAGAEQFSRYCLDQDVSTNANQKTESYDYTFYANVTNDIAKDYPIRLPLPLSDMKNWDDRQNVQYNVNGTSNEVTLVEAGNTPYLEVSTNYGDSSLEEGIWTFGTSYDYQSGSSGGTGTGDGGGGGGGGGAGQGAQPQRVFEIDSPISIQLQELDSVENSLPLTNLDDNEYEITINDVGGDGCRYIGFTTDGLRYFTQMDFQTDDNVSYRVEVPDVDEEQELSCTYEFIAENDYKQEVRFEYTILPLQSTQTATAFVSAVSRPVLGANAKICTDLNATIGAQCKQYTQLNQLTWAHVLTAITLLLIILFVARSVVKGKQSLQWLKMEWARA